MQIKVCFLIAGFSAGGAQRQCIALLNELQNDSELDLHLICFYEGINYHLLEHKRITVHLVNVGSFYNPLNIFKIASILKNIEPQVMISWLHASDVYAFFLKILYRNSKWIMTERDSHYPFDPRYLLRSITAKGSDMIVANSNKGEEYWLKKGIKSNKVMVIRNILNLPKYNSKINLEGDPIIVYAGRLEIQKNVIVLANAFCKLSDQYPLGKFYIIGEGSLRDRISDIIIENKKQEKVLLLPFKKNIHEYFMSADIFVNISHHEGTPNTVIENIQLQNIVLVSKISEHSDILGKDYPYYLNDLKSIDEFSSLVNTIIASKNKVEYLKYALNDIASMKPSIITRQYKDLFKHMAND